MTRACLLALCCLAPVDTSRHGTAIAALRDKGEIAIAADSRVLDRFGMRQPDACKLRVIGDTVVAVHGLAVDEAADFDLFKLAEASLSAQADLGEVLRRLASSATAPLTRAVTRVLEEDPLMLKAPGLANNPAGVVFARIERGTPKMGYVRFVTRHDAGGPLTLAPESQLCPGDCPTGIGAILVSPDTAAEAMFEHWHPEYWKHALGPQAIAFVETQIQGPYADIGPPVDAIRIANGRITWIARKDGCREKE
jgi:hypothetical protein